MHLITQLDRAATQRFPLFPRSRLSLVATAGTRWCYSITTAALTPRALVWKGVLARRVSIRQCKCARECTCTMFGSIRYSMLELYEKKLDPKFGRNVQSIVVVHPTYR